MSLDLALLPFEGSEEVPFSHSVLRTTMSYALGDELMEMEKRRGRDVPVRFSSYLCRDEKYEESHYGNTQFTPYGERLKEVEVEDLLAFRDHELVQINPRNRAVWAYLAELPPRTRIALYWS